MLDFDHDNNHFVDIQMWDYGAIAIDTRGKLWGWGRNYSWNLGFLEENRSGLYSPKLIEPLNELNMKVKKIDISNSHSLILFEDDNGKDHLYSIGANDPRYLGLTQEEYVDANTQKERPYRELT